MLSFPKFIITRNNTQTRRLIISKFILLNKVMFYAMRALNNIFVLEIYTHSNFASALSKINANRNYWINFTGSECLFMGFLNLIFIWLKFLTIWRLARAAALIDGNLFYYEIH